MNYALHLNKNTASAVFLSGVISLMALYHRTDTFSAKGFLNLFAIFNHSDLLEVGFKGPICRSQRKTAVVPKGRCLSTGIALSHFFKSLSLH